jgi:hypothetical protein
MGRDIELLTLKFLDKFFHKTHKGIIESVIIPIIEGNSKLSLRFIENYITKYCKEHPTFIKTKNNNFISIYDDYINQLKSFGKCRFDIFNRRHSTGSSSSLGSNNSNNSSDSLGSKNPKESKNKTNLIAYPCDEEGTRRIITSIRQLNFFRWLIQTDILNYIIKNYDFIKDKTVLKRERKLRSKIYATNNTSSTTESLEIHVI